jgi:hypothetical protein
MPRLWFALRDRRLGGFKFVRIVEVDGGQHAENARDRARAIGCSPRTVNLTHCAFLELGRAEQSGWCFAHDPC